MTSTTLPVPPSTRRARLDAMPDNEIIVMQNVRWGRWAYSLGPDYQPGVTTPQPKRRCDDQADSKAVEDRTGVPYSLQHVARLETAGQFPSGYVCAMRGSRM